MLEHLISLGETIIVNESGIFLKKRIEFDNKFYQIWIKSDDMESFNKISQKLNC